MKNAFSLTLMTYIVSLFGFFIASYYQINNPLPSVEGDSFGVSIYHDYFFYSYFFLLFLGLLVGFIYSIKKEYRKMATCFFSGSIISISLSTINLMPILGGATSYKDLVNTRIYILVIFHLLILTLIFYFWKKAAK
jgi:hypothetical protein